MQKISLYIIPLLILVSLTLGCQEEKEYIANQSNALSVINSDPFRSLLLHKIKNSGNFHVYYSAAACKGVNDRSKPDELYFSVRTLLSNIDSISDQNIWTDLNDRTKKMHKQYVDKLDNNDRNCRDIQTTTLMILDKLFKKDYQEYLNVQDQLNYVNLLVDLNNIDYDELAENIDAMYGKIPSEDFVRLADYLHSEAKLVVDNYFNLEKELKKSVESAVGDTEKTTKLSYYSKEYTRYKSAEYALSLLDKYYSN